MSEQNTIPAGKLVWINAYKSAPGAGLSYPCMQVTLLDPCETDGWDVIDAKDADGREVSVYSFSVVREPAPRYGADGTVNWNATYGRR